MYTDGSCLKNPGRGGWAAILIHGKKTKEISGSENNSTNNRMELMAMIKGLEALKIICDAHIYSDSAYVINAFEKDWITSWQKNNWRTSTKKEVLNLDLWKRLIALTEKHRVTFHKVKGHSDNELNNKCDILARTAASQLPE